MYGKMPCILLGIKVDNHVSPFHIDCVVFDYHLQPCRITTTRFKGVCGDVGEVRSPVCLSDSQMNRLYGELEGLENEQDIEIG